MDSSAPIWADGLGGNQLRGEARATGDEQGRGARISEVLTINRILVDSLPSSLPNTLTSL